MNNLSRQRNRSRQHNAVRLPPQLQALLPPLLFLAIVLVSWQLIGVWINFPKILLPSPLEILVVAFEKRSQLAAAAWITSRAALSGFALALLLGTSSALVFSVSQLARRAIYPYMILLQTVPIVAIAPLVIIWFGGGLNSIVAIITIISVFPIATNVTTGLTSIDPGRDDLMTLYGANNWQKLWKLRLPTALPYLISGARVSSGLTIVGAIVGEYMAGYQSQSPGLGYYVFLASTNAQSEILYASIFISTMLGILLFGLVTLVGKTALARWTYEMEQ